MLAPPVFLQHGDKDSYVPYLQSVDFIKAGEGNRR